MPPRRRRPTTSKPASASTRVHKIASREQWESMLQKAGENRIVVVQFYQAAVWACSQMRPFFAKQSTNPKFRHAIFAEVDVDEHEAIATAANVTRLPTYHCYHQGKVVDSYTGAAPVQLQQFIQRQVTEFCAAPGGPLAVAARLAAAAVLLAGGAFLYARLRGEGGGEGGGGGGDAGSQLLDLKKRLVAAQAKLRALEKANRVKQVRTQRKLLEQLHAQRRALERGQQSARAKGAAAAAPAAAREQELQAAGRNERGSAALDLDADSLARLRRRKRQGGAVLYSDEEDALAAAEDDADDSW